MAKVAFGTVIYSQSRCFLQDLINSVENQTDQDFDFLILNDNYTDEELDDLPLPKDAIVVNENSKKLTPGLLRIELLKEAKERGFDLLIIGDADDTFATTRVAAYKKAYELDKSFAFYYNNLVTDKGEEVFDFVPDVIRNVRPISQGNFLGMSTTAINLNLLSYEFIESLREGQCNIFDWYLYSRILMDVGTGKRVEFAETIYRIHENNEVGVSVDVERELKVKLEHYERLKQYSYFVKLKYLYQTTDINTLDTTTTNHNYWWSNIFMEENYEI